MMVPGSMAGDGRRFDKAELDALGAFCGLAAGVVGAGEVPKVGV